MRHLRFALGFVLLHTLALPALSAEAQSYNPSDFKTKAGSIDFACITLAVPNAVICELFKRDRLLQAALAGRQLRFHAFPQGPDVVRLISENRIDVTAIGDLPTLQAAARNEVRIIGMVRHGYVTIVGAKGRSMSDLKGQRIGFVPGTSAHYGLLQALDSVQLAESDVRMLSFPIDGIATALLDGKIDAFALHEPIPSGLIARYPDRYGALYRNISNAYLVVGHAGIAITPELPRHLAAALWRAVGWLRRSRANLLQAAQWTQQSAAPFSGDTSLFNQRDIVNATREMLLDVQEAPALPRDSRDEASTLGREFHFMQRTHRLPADVQWEQISQAFDFEAMQSVLADPRHYRIDEFDYIQ